MKKTTLTKIALNDLKCISQWFSFLLNDTPLPLILGCKNEKRLSGPTELDLEAGNLVLRGPQYQVELIERRIAIYILSIRSNQILKYSLYHITVPPFCEVKNIHFIRPCLKEVI